MNLRPRRPSPITIADCARDARQWKTAAQYYSKALKRNPANPPIWVQYGHALKEMGSLSDAERAYQQAVAYESTHYDGWLHLGHVLRMQSQDRRAAAAYLAAFAVAQEAKDVLNGLGSIDWLDAELTELRAWAGKNSAPMNLLSASAGVGMSTVARGTKGAFRLVYVSGEPHTPGHSYRVLRPMHAAARAGAQTAWMRPDEICARQAEIETADAVIFWRTAWDDSVALGINVARRNGAKIVFDIDDLIVDPLFATTEVFDGIRSDNLQQSSVQEYFSKLQKTMLASDLCLTTTEELAEYIRKAFKPTLVLQNGFDNDSLRVACLAARRRAWDPGDGLIRIGYATGSMTHQRDFAQCAAAVASVLREYPESRLVTFRTSSNYPGGDSCNGSRPILQLTEFACLRDLEDRIEWRAYVPLDQLPNELARFDINLVPLEIGNPFCEAKSELKYFEAALAGVASIASATGPFRRAIRHQETGFLAKTMEDWHHGLSALVSDRQLRKRVAEAAYRDVLWTFGPERRVESMATLLDLLKGGRHAARAFEKNLHEKTNAQSMDPVVPEYVTDSSEAASLLEIPIRPHQPKLVEAKAVMLLFSRERRDLSLIARACRAREAGQWPIVARLCRKFLDRNPRRWDAWVEYGHALKESGNLAEAENAYRSAIIRNPAAADCHIQLGHLLRLRGRSKEAEAAYLRAFAVDPSEPASLEGLSSLGWSASHRNELQVWARQDSPTTVG